MGNVKGGHPAIVLPNYPHLVVMIANCRKQQVRTPGILEGFADDALDEREVPGDADADGRQVFASRVSC